MTKKNRSLPLVVSSSLGGVEILRKGLSSSFESKVREGKVTCSEGCSSCCYHPINISILEGILIYRHLLGEGKWTTVLKARLKETADKQFGTTYEVWLLSLIPCPLLQDNRCLAYSARPLICRTYYARSDPHYCHPHRLGDNTSLVPRGAVVDEFIRKQEQILRKLKLQMLVMPIGLALLLAERVVLGTLDIDMVDSMILREYGDKT